KPAPQPLRRIQALVNTVERPDGADRLADPSDARPWMIANGLLAPSAELTAADLALAIEGREALRALLIHNAGGPRPGPEAVAPLQRIAAKGRLRAAVGDAGVVTLRVDGDSVADRLAGLLPVIR